MSPFTLTVRRDDIGLRHKSPSVFLSPGLTGERLGTCIVVSVVRHDLTKSRVSGKLRLSLKSVPKTPDAIVSGTLVSCSSSCVSFAPPPTVSSLRTTRDFR